MLERSVTVIVPGAGRPAETLSTLRSLSAQTLCVEILVICEEEDRAALKDIEGPAGPASLTIVSAEGTRSPAEQANRGIQAAGGSFIAFAPAGTQVPPQYFERMLAKADPRLGGILLKTSAADPLPRSWSRPSPKAPRGVAQLLGGALAPWSLLARSDALRACGSLAPDTGDGYVFALALRLGLSDGIGGVDLPDVVTPSFPPLPPVDVLDATTAAWLSDARAPLPDAAALMEMRAAARDRWRLTHRAVSDAIEAFVGREPLVLGAPHHAEAWREEVRRRLPRAEVVALAPTEDLVATLRQLVGAAADARYVIIADDDAPDADRLVRMVLRAQAEDLDACLPVVDDGTFHPPRSSGLIGGALFRRETLGAFLAANSLRDEHEFWTLFADTAAIDAVEIAPPGAPNPDDARFYAEHLVPADEDPTAAPAKRRGWRRLLRRRRRGSPSASPPGPEPMGPVARLRDWLGPYLPAALRGRRDPFALLVDEAWYYRHRADVYASGMTAGEHYRKVGWREGMDPNPYFSTRWYLEANDDVRQRGFCPLDHYVDAGAQQMLADRAQIPFFDPIWYTRRYGVSPQPAYAPLADLIANGAALDRVPHPLFEHDAVQTHLTLVDPSGRADEIAALWETRVALSREPVVFSWERFRLLCTALLWELPPGTEPVLVPRGQQEPHPEAGALRLRSDGDGLRLSFGKGGTREIVFPGKSRFEDIERVFAAIDARFNASDLTASGLAERD